MSTITKLSLQGIRSYSPDKAEIIKFEKPLTIIVGSNGSGKTSIIEALKFVCTGSNPPISDHGKSFVHDPQVAGNPLVKAKIMLAFRTADGQSITTIRNVQVTQKKTRREYKQIDTVLKHKDKDGKVVSISKKCADMDKQTPLLLGVSKAVLENVIFCHQEESNWPLESGKVLKEKFDDIFASTRYTKALELIRKVHKDKTSEVKDEERDLAVLAHIREDAHRKGAEFQDKKEKVAAQAVEIQKLEEKEHEMEQQLNALLQQNSAIQGRSKKLYELRANKQVLERLRDEAREAVTEEFTDSDEEVLRMHKEIEATINSKKADKAKAQADLQQLDHEQRAKTADVQRLTQERGRQNALAEENDTRERSLQQDVGRLAETHKIREFQGRTGSYTFAEMSRFGERMMELIDRRKQELQREETNQRELDTGLEKEVREKTARVSKIREGVDHRTRGVSDVERELRETQQKQAEVNAFLSEFNDVNDRIARKERELEELKHSDLKTSIEEEIAKQNNRMKGNTQRMRAIESEQKSLAAHNLTFTRMKVNREQRDQLERQLLPQLERCKPVLQSMLGHVPAPSEMQEATRSALATRARSHKQRAADSARLQSELQLRQDELKKYTSEMQELQRQLDESSVRFKRELRNHESQPVALRAAIKAVENAYKTKTITESFKDTYEKFNQTAAAKHVCPVCERGLKSEELKTFIEKNTEKIDGVQNSGLVQDMSTRWEEAKREKKRIEKLGEAWTKYEHMRSEQKPALSRKISDIQVQIDQLRIESKDADEKASEDMMAKEQLEEVMAVASKVAQYSQQIADLDRALAQDEASIKNVARSGRTPEKLQDEREAVQRDNEHVASELSRLQTQKEKFEQDVQARANQLHQLKENSHSLLVKKAELQRLADAVTKLQQRRSTLQSETSVLQDQLLPLENDIKGLMEQRRLRRAEAQQTVDAMRRAGDALRREYDSFISVFNHVKAWHDGKADRERKLAALSKAEESIADLERSREQTKAIIANATKLLEKYDELRKVIEANRALRARSRDLAEVNEALKQMGAALSDESNAQDLLQDIERLQREIHQISNTRAAMEGRKMELEESAFAILKDLKSEKYKNIDDKHRTKLIKVHTTKFALKDLKTYQIALNNALMKFHQLKMKEINDVLKEYWRATYQGHDIDEIAIRSDCEEKGDRNRVVYDYRVVMKVGDSELDMRGRCSAGQKVLASLLIRLALAETFGLQCGVLALDEPTTNLDHKNIEAFAKALGRIINKRRDQDNFQLLLITHDEAFVELLGKRANADMYYRVAKNKEQYSTITAQPID